MTYSYLLHWVSQNAILCCGVWVVYKFMFPLKAGLKTIMRRQGTYTTMHESRNETLKPLTRDHVFSPEPSWDEDEHGKYWVIRMVTTAFEIIFVPVREDFFDKK